MVIVAAQGSSVGPNRSYNRNAFKGGGRSLTAAGRVSKTMRKASRADERASEAAEGYSGGAKNDNGLR